MSWRLRKAGHVREPGFLAETRVLTLCYPTAPPAALAAGRPPAAFALCEQDCLLGLDGPFKNDKAEVIRKPDSTIGWLRMGGRIYTRN
jgi:hypothetical protein